MPQKILLVMHQTTSDPGRVGEALRTRGYELDMRVPAMGDPLPATMGEHTAAVIFGGPMSVNDDYPFIRAEMTLIEKLLATSTPYLGICLGAQLMARTLGARVSEHPEGLREIGYYKVNPANDGCTIFKQPMMVYQWHREGFELPRGAALLASGDYFANQAFRVGENAYGIQFHPEVTEAMNRRWATKAAHMLSDPGAQSRAEQLEGRRLYDDALRVWLDNFLDHWLPEPQPQQQLEGAEARAPAVLRQPAFS